MLNPASSDSARYFRLSAFSLKTFVCMFKSSEDYRLSALT